MVFVVLVILALGYCRCQEWSTSVHTTDGPIQGFRDQNGVNNFLGVPFASPPIGTFLLLPAPFSFFLLPLLHPASKFPSPFSFSNPPGNLRWKATQPSAPWTSVKNTSKFSAACMQPPGMPFPPDATFSEVSIFSLIYFWN